MSQRQHKTESTTKLRFTDRQASDLLSLLTSDGLRYWAKVRRGPSCWLWEGSTTPDGYGTISVGGRPVYTHRLAWAIVHGPIPVGQSVLHRCDTPGCVNPAHLFLGTQRDNMRDAVQKGRLRIARRRTRSFKPDVIARYLDGGVTAAALASEYGVHKLTVLRWVHAAGIGDLRAARLSRVRKAVA